MGIEAMKGISAAQMTSSVGSQAKPVEVNASPTVDVASAGPENREPISSAKTDVESGSSKENGKSMDEEKIREAVAQVNNKMKNYGAEKTRCEFSYHEGTHRISIKIYDANTKKVIKEIPPEETLKMVEKMWEIAGLLVDERR